MAALRGTDTTVAVPAGSPPDSLLAGQNVLLVSLVQVLCCVWPVSFVPVPWLRGETPVAAGTLPGCLAACVCAHTRAGLPANSGPTQPVLFWAWEAAASAVC